MIKSFVELFKNIALRHKSVYTFRYQGDDYNNAQNNYRTYQVYMDTYSVHQLNITTNIFIGEFQLYILSQPDGTSGNTVEDVQTNAFTIAVDILGAIENWEEYKGVLSLHDYSILTLDRYSDDSSAGVKLSVVLEYPSPLNLCTLDDNFDDEPHEEEPDHEIDIDSNEVGDIDINPIKLPRNNINC